MFNNAHKLSTQEELHHAHNIIGQETHLEGDLHTTGNLRVEGKIHGGVQTKAKLAVGDTAIIEGNIQAQTAEISGHIKGAVHVTGLLTLKATAIVQGDIVTHKLVFEEGAQFNGTCHMHVSEGRKHKIAEAPVQASKKEPTHALLNKSTPSRQAKETIITNNSV